jgi:dTDP-4-amino-4,6-dideoxygalactose transaminase
MVAIPRRSVHLYPGEIHDLLGLIQKTPAQGVALVAAFEDALARHIGVRHAIATGSGRLGLRVTLEALGVGAGHGVIVPAYTDQSVPQTIRKIGAEPLYVDVDTETHNIDPARLTPEMGRKAMAIIPTHLFGAPAPMKPILSFAKKYKLHVIEDCAHAIDASIGGRRCGGFGQAALFSFVVTKAVNTFGGGMMVTNDDGLAMAIRAAVSSLPEPDSNALLGRIAVAYGLHTATHPHVFGVWGRMLLEQSARGGADPISMYNRFVRSGTVNAHVETRLSPIQAGVGLVQMRALKNTQGRREALAKRLIAVLPPTWIPQALTAEQTHAWYFLVVTCPEPDRAVRDLLQRGVDVGRAPMRNCAAIDDAGAGPTQFSVAQSLMERSLQIPIHPTMDDAMMDHLVEAVRTLPR